jgi:hypothetical protein
MGVAANAAGATHFINNPTTAPLRQYNSKQERNHEKNISTRQYSIVCSHRGAVRFVFNLRIVTKLRAWRYSQGGFSQLPLPLNMFGEGGG